MVSHKGRKDIHASSQKRRPDFRRRGKRCLREISGIIKGRYMSIKVINEKCVGCKLCVKACPFSAIDIVNKKAVIDLDKCTLCGACIESCKFDAIVLTKISPTDIQFPKKFHEYKDVWVFCEQKKGVVQSVAYELLGKGRELADTLGVDLCGVLLGENIKEEAQKVIH